MALSSREKREVLRQLLERERGHARPRSYPLSWGQERVWLDQQLNPESSLHRVIAAARVDGPLDVALLTRSLNEVIKRHESLRTTFVEVDDRPRQIVAPALTITPRLVDLGEIPEPARLGEAERRAREESRASFDLARGPLLRALLVRLAETDHLMVLIFHHIIIDAWSARLFAGELWQFYNAFPLSSVPVLSELPIQYGDFAAWQRAYFQGGTVERDLAYWKETLRGPLPTLELPIDHARGPAAIGPCGTCNFEIPAELQAGIQILAGREGVTPFMVLLAAYQGLLSVYSDQEDIVVGCPVAGRDRPETQALVGFFISVVLIRTDLGGNPTFCDLLQRVRQTCLGAYAHQELPVEMLLDGLEWKRHMQGGRHSPVRALFNLLEEPSTESWRRIGLAITLIELWPDQTDLDLNLHLRRRGGELSGTLLYRQDIFEAATIDQLVTDFLALLRAAVADPTLSLAALGMSDEARQRLRFKRYRAHRAASLDRLDDIERLSNLTKRQLLVWAGHKLRPTAPIYNLAATLVIDGPVDRACFARAFQTLLNSSDALRTVIEERDGIPWQRALPPYPYTMSYQDFAARPDPQAALDAWTTERVGRPFDLAERLFEVILVKLDSMKYVCVFMQDHIVTDGWSIWLTFQQLATLYEQALAEALPPQIPLPQYDAWLAHERAYRFSSRYVRDRDYWAAKLADPPDPLVFYGASPRKGSTRVDRISCALGVERSRRLQALATERAAVLGGRHAFLFSVFAGAFCAFLHHVAGVRRLTFVTDVHNRRTRAFKETLGLFLEMVPLRVEVDEETTFDALVTHVREEMLTSLRHAQFPVSHVVHRPEVELNYHTFSNETHRKVDGAPVHTSVIHTGHQEESFGIRVLDFENSGNFTLDFDLHCDVFPEERRPLVIQHFLRVLDELLEDPHQPIGRISVVTPRERDRLLTDFNRTEVSFPLERTFADLFEAQVGRTPDRPAALGEGGELTYRQLDGRANALAHRLQALGVGPDVLVGICLERSLDAVISLLAVTKAGGAWVPLDPAYPTDRLEGILTDSRAPVVVARRAMLDRLPGLAAHVIDLDTEGGGFTAAAPARATGPRDLAYVIYTSGSTGAPKGAMIEQRGMLNHLLAKVQDLELTEVDAVAQTASLAFDISVWQCFAALLVGGRVHVVPDGVAHDPGRLPVAVEAHGISVLEVVPSLLRAMNEELADAGADRPAFLALRWLMATGEELPPTLCHQWLSMYPSIPLLNAYGPTECSDDVTHHVIRTPPPASLLRIPIGRPIANTRVYVLDRALQPIPIGVAGELCVGGAGVGRGYLHDARRTQEAFVPDPFSPTPGPRLYRTGDRARFLPDGSLEFLGRLDHQVKIRGHRIEPGEIEGVLARHPAVAGCAVVARSHGQDELRLVAYVVPAAGGQVDPVDLRDFLRATIPEAMIPAAFVALDALPLTPNGKVDRRALPEPARDQAGAATRFVRPRSETEHRLAEIWEDAFGVRPIGVTESFFDLGGHSLMALRMMGRIRAAFGEELPLAALLGEPTIEALARRLDHGASSAASSPLVPIQPHGSRLPLFCVHPSGGSVMDYHRLARHLGKDQPFFGLEARGLDGEAEPLTSVEEMARSYIAAMRQARPTGPYALAGHSFGGIVAFEMARQLLEDGQPVALVALADAWGTPAAAEPTVEDRVTLLSGIGHELGLPLDHIDVAWEHFWRLPPAEQVTYALDVAVASRVLPAEMSLAQIRRSLTLHVINIDAMRRYVARPVSCPLVILRASEELSLTPRDPALGWGGLTTGRVEVLTVPGNHFSMLREPHVQIVAERLRGYLEASTRAGA